MLLIAAQDDGRLSEDPRLANLFRSLPALPPREPSAVINSLAAFEEDLVLFWHEEAELALEALGEIQSQNLWPQNLFGVVLFRAAHYAGLGTRRSADAELIRRGLDRKRIHVLNCPVRDSIPVELADGIQNFAASLAQAKPTYPTFGFLQPAKHNDAALTLRLIDWLNKADPVLGAQVMQKVLWQSVGENLALDFGRYPSPEVVALEAARLRAANLNCAEECELCGERQYLYHSTEKLNGLPQHLRLNELRATVPRAISLIDSAQEIADAALENTLNALLIHDFGEINAPLREILREQLRDQCRLQNEVRDELRHIHTAVQQELSEADLRQAAENLCRALACNAFLGFRF